MFIKKHFTDRGILLAVADENLIGRRFSEGKFELEVSEDFYKGELVSEKELEKHMKQAYLLNIVGSSSISVALKLGLISKEDILLIEGVPHAQSILIYE